MRYCFGNAIFPDGPPNKQLSTITPYLVLAIFPVAFLLGFSFNVPELVWGARLALEGRPLEPMSASPDEVREKAAAFRRYAFILGDAIILGLVALVMNKNTVPAARVGLHLANWEINVATGIGAGILLAAARGLMVIAVPVDPQGSFTWEVRRGHPLLWVLIFIAGAFSEELWLAFCLVALKTTGHSTTLSIAMTVVVFAAMHYSYGFWGAVGVALVESVSALLFLHFGSLFVTFFYHLLGNLGSLYLHRHPQAAGGRP